MKKIIPVIFVLFAVLTSCNSPEHRIRAAVNRQLEQFPGTTLQDIYKSFFQDNFGPGHIVSDTSAARAYIIREIGSANKYDPYYVEPAGEGVNFYRVSLAVVADSIVTLDDYCDAFFRSVKDIDPIDVEKWKNQWNDIRKVIDEMNLNLPDYDKDAATIDSLLNVGQYVYHHSERYNRYHHPHYRLIKKDVVINEIQPLIDSTRVYDPYAPKDDD